MKGRIAEIFESIQGEGLYFGERQLFVRFYGCNLKCGFCDTQLPGYKVYEPQELFDEIKRYAWYCHSISFTGGEPLLQKDFLKEILALSRDAGFRTYLETNGTLAEELGEVIDYLDIVSMDIKLPSSTGDSAYWEKHNRFAQVASRKELLVKIIVCKSSCKDDFKKAVDLMSEYKDRIVMVLQPNTFEQGKALHNKIEEFKGICEEEEFVSCVIPQMHKVISIK